MGMHEKNPITDVIGLFILMWVLKTIQGFSGSMIHFRPSVLKVPWR
jgi:hypothetical protein